MQTSDGAAGERIGLNDSSAGAAERGGDDAGAGPALADAAEKGTDHEASEGPAVEPRAGD